MSDQIDPKFKCAYTRIVPIDTLIPNPKNPNEHPDAQIDLLAKIIDLQGQRAPVVVSNRSGFITKGHGRLMAMQKLGWKAVAVDFQNYESEAMEYADMVADNKIAELAETNMNKVNELALEMPKDFDFDLLGIPDFKIEAQEAELPFLSGGEPDCQTVTFILSNEQKDILDEALAKAKKEEYCEDGINQNSNGNALAAIVKRYVHG